MQEVTDTDSGITLHSGAGGPAVSAAQDAARAARRRQRELEARLEARVQELRRLCLREAELTGALPPEFPLKGGEKPPRVRRRIGAAFKLDETLVLRGADPLSALERDLALQLQIARAAQRLCREENISKQLRKRRKSAARREERKLKELEDTLNECRLLAARRPPPAGAEEPAASDESSLSDAAPPEEDESRPPRAAPPAPAEPQDRPPSPARAGAWHNTGLGKLDADASGAPAASPAPRTPRAGEVPPYRFVPIRSLALRRRLGSSAPGTPEPPGRRGQSPSPRADGCWEPAEPRGRGTLPRRRPTYYTVTVPAYCFPAPGPASRSGSDDSNSDGSGVSRATSPGSSSPDVSCRRPPAACCYRGVPGFPAPAGVRAPGAGRYEQDLAPLRYQRLVPSHSRIVRTPSLKDSAPAAGRGLSRAAVSEELRSWHERARLRGARPRSLDRPGALRVPGAPPRHPGPWRGSQPRAQMPQVHMLKRAPDGGPVQVYVSENGEIITQV